MANDRMAKLAHYICAYCDPDKLGETKLNKMLWYIDTYAYRRLAKTISGEESYIKRQYGPVARNTLATIEFLEKKEAIVVRNVNHFGHPKKEYIARNDPDKSCFSQEEQDIINQVVDIIGNEHTAESISDLSHDIIWGAAKLGEEIPVSAVLASTPAIVTGDDLNWADTIVSQVN